MWVLTLSGVANSDILQLLLITSLDLRNGPDPGAGYEIWVKPLFIRTGFVRRSMSVQLFEQKTWVHSHRLFKDHAGLKFAHH